MPDSPAQWALLAAIPVLFAAGSLSVLHWSRYLGALTRLQSSRTALPPSTAAWLELRSAQHYRRACRHTWGVVAVLAVGLAGALLTG